MLNNNKRVKEELLAFEDLQCEIASAAGWDMKGETFSEFIRRIVKENATLLAQLPEGMKHCTIQFKSCPVGHGRLTATNWSPSECKQCEIEKLRAELKTCKEGAA